MNFKQNKFSRNSLFFRGDSGEISWKRFFSFWAWAEASLSALGVGTLSSDRINCDRNNLLVFAVQ